MALVSPGVEVTVIDESQYVASVANSVPLIVLATAQNKTDPSRTAIAAGTLAENAGKLYQVTSQRDLVTLFGSPFFYESVNGTPIQGYELNEYGLLAAYSVLGVTNTCYVLRADVDLAELVGKTGRPSGEPATGINWLDTTNTTWGIFEFNATTGKFTNKVPVVITEASDLVGGIAGQPPTTFVGNPGDYAVVSLAISTMPDPDNAQYFYKTQMNEWVQLGSLDWAMQHPTISAVKAYTVTQDGYLDTGESFDLELDDGAVMTITGCSNIYEVSQQINLAGWTQVHADVVNNKLVIYSGGSGSKLTIYPSNDEIAGTATILSDIGISWNENTNSGEYYSPEFYHGSAANMPLWTYGQAYPKPTGSVWLKVGAAGNGLNPVVKTYDAELSRWSTNNQLISFNDWDASETLDPTGGAAIPAGTMYSQILHGGDFLTSPVYMWRRVATGPTVITGTVNNPVFESGPYTAKVKVSIPNGGLSDEYPLVVDDQADQDGFVAAWQAAGIPYTQASVTSSGGIQIIHTAGGEIIVDDTNSGVVTGVTGIVPGSGYTNGTYQNIDILGAGSGATATVTVSGNVVTSIVITGGGSGYVTATLDTTQLDAVAGGAGGNCTLIVSDGVSNDLMETAGFIRNFTDGVKFGPSITLTHQPVADSTGGSGSGLQINVSATYGKYTIDQTSFEDAGLNYAVGDTVTFAGSDMNGGSGNDLVVVVTSVNAGSVTGIAFISGEAHAEYSYLMSNWRAFDYIPNEGAPVADPTDGTMWYYSVADEVDIMINRGGQWHGYRNVKYDLNGFPLPSNTIVTDLVDPNGPIVQASEPFEQTDGTPLVYGDLWIDSSDLENYPMIYRWQKVGQVNKWVLVDKTNQTDFNGVVFADARWGTNEDVHPVNDPITPISLMVTSDYIDLDCPDANLYPTGMLLFNTRRSGYNIKQYSWNYFNGEDFPDMELPDQASTWVTVSGNKEDGSPYMGRKSQRHMVVKALRSVVETNQTVRDEDNYFNLMATPGYPELQPSMITLNSDRGETAFIVGDTPFRLEASGTEIQAWARNEANAVTTGEDGCVSRSTYMGLFYPSGIASDPTGNLVTVPSSHMMLRTFLRNDQVAYPWFAAAGVRRGIIDNATNIGYIQADTGEFNAIKTSVGLRDVLYTNFMNPLAFFTNQGLLCYGNKSSFDSSSALDRINVSRLVVYLRRVLTLAMRPFVFEPNDVITRKQVQGVVESLMIDLIAKRGIYDFLVVCDESNNTPARIDRNELWVDVAIEPVKAAEFIYVPIRIMNTGEIADRLR